MYRINVFEIDKGKNKLFVQYSEQNAQQSFEKFVKSVHKSKKPMILAHLTQDLAKFETAEAAEAAALELIAGLEKEGYQVIAGPLMQQKFWQLYVIEIDNNPMKVYVGQSIYDPELRLEQHKAGINSSAKVRQTNNPHLRPDLYAETGKFESREEAQKAEVRLAEALTEDEFKVYGGH